MSEMMKIPVSVLIPTKNEERNLPTTLEMLRHFDEIIVFDSFSADRTRAIAESFGCSFYQRVFDNFSDHKNWALRNIPFRHEWILILDADEKVSAELAEEISVIVSESRAYNAYYVARQIWVDGVWLKHAGKYPDYNLRLFRRGHAWYERRIVHEHMLTDGPVGFLKNHLVHVDDKGTSRYVERHNRYAEMEAVEALIAIRSAAGDGSFWGAFRSRTYERRRLLKVFAYRYLPFRPALVFIYLYVFRLGFLMGRVGFKTCELRRFYEYLIDLYLEELEDPQSPVSLRYGDYIRQRLAPGSDVAAANQERISL